MAAINDSIARIQDPDLRQRIEKEVKELTKQKKFGLVFENHIPEMTLLYDYPISRGCKVIRKSDDDKKQPWKQLSPIYATLLGILISFNALLAKA